MKIIQVHNYYQQAGGEDAVVEAERAMLERDGNIVIPYYRSNDDISASGNKLIAISQLLKASVNTLWNHQTYREFRKLLQKEKPDVVHCHNTFPLISPSLYYACAKEKIPVVQTIHNFRLACASPFFYRDGKICEQCVGKTFPYPAIRYRCYRRSFAGSAVWTCMIFLHRVLGTYRRKIDGYIALMDFVKDKLIKCGLPRDKIKVKPNFIQRTEDRGQKPEKPQTSDFKLQASQNYALFVGRLSPEKGCDVLLRAWSIFTSNVKPPTSNPVTLPPQLLIVGDGPERAALETLSSDTCPPSSVTFLGQQPKESVLSLMRDAQFLVFPSVWYETFGLTVLEAGLCNTPAIISAPTTTSGMIQDGRSGLLYELGNTIALAEKIEWAFLHPAEMQKMGDAAHADFENHYSEEVNYRQLMDIYDQVIGG